MALSPLLAAVVLARTVALPSEGAAPKSRLSVATEGGIVRGAVDGDLLAYKGIPYAQPPVGDLRWRAPQAVLPWTGVRDARC